MSKPDATAKSIDDALTGDVDSVKTVKVSDIEVSKPDAQDADTVAADDVSTDVDGEAPETSKRKTKKSKKSKAKKSKKSEAKEGDEDEDEGGGLGELISTVVWALGIALVLRTFIFQPFTIPSASMYPGLMEGDYVITSKYSVGYGQFAAAPFPFIKSDGRLLERGPERGDVIVFRPPGSNDNFIKRVVGLPGDRVQMIDGRLFINDAPVPSEVIRREPYIHRQNGYAAPPASVALVAETLPGRDAPNLVYDAQANHPLDNTDVTTVRPGYYFMMGDNRDHSSDSRVSASRGGAGAVPASNIIGRAEFILLSVDDGFVLYKPWTWGNLRGDRWFKRVK